MDNNLLDIKAKNLEIILIGNYKNNTFWIIELKFDWVDNLEKNTLILKNVTITDKNINSYKKIIFGLCINKTILLKNLKKNQNNAWYTSNNFIIEILD